MRRRRAAHRVRQVPEADLAALQQATLALYSQRDLQSFRAALPGIFLGLIPADYFSLADMRFDFKRESVRILDLWESRPVRAGRLLPAFEKHVFHHPFTQQAFRHGIDGAYILTDFMSLPELRRTPLYREMLRPANIGRQISTGSMSGPGLAALTLARPESAPNFTERDRWILEVLRPHFDQARTNLERETRQRARRSRSLAELGLTARETEVALWLAQGKSNPEIAAILPAPVRTVEKHVERVLEKLEVENRAGAAVAVAAIIRADATPGRGGPEELAAAGMRAVRARQRRTGR